jgi:very-short-patch-repair endonuclease
LEGCPQGGVVNLHDMQKEILTHINETSIYQNFPQNLLHNPLLKERAKKLRKAGVLSEVVFWRQVAKGNFHNIDFDRQRIIGNYIVDFYVKSLGLIIEIDGTSHNDKDVYDLKRDKYLESFDLKIFRTTEPRVMHDLENVMNELEQFIIENYR